VLTSPTGPATTTVDVLSLAEVAKLCAEPRALIVDARDASAFAEGHVAGAIHLPCASSRGAASAAMDLLAGKDILIVYGDGTDDAKPVAAEMLNRGSRRDIRYAVLAGGFRAWNRGGFACASGPCPDCAGTVAGP
jgi:rhodanese-related sulfurtransferase